jgi:hypothetical protein
MSKKSNFLNLNIIGINFRKMKLNYAFINFKFIIFYNQLNNYNLKDFLLKKSILNFSLKNNEIKSVFNLNDFCFLKNSKFLCIFTSDITLFINIITFLEKKHFFYIYKSCLSNLVFNYDIIDEYHKYNRNYTYIQFILKKVKIKIIILIFIYIISFIQYIKN